jgi:hypothetical protein
MAIADYFKGPKHKARADQLVTELAELQVRHASLQEQAEKCGALELFAVQGMIQNAT